MPPVGGFVALCVNSRGQCPDAQKTKIYGDFFKVELIPNTDTLKGKLIINFNAYRICHGGIKVRLEGNLELRGKTSTCKQIDIFENCPTETILSCDDLVRGQKRCNFTLTLPPGHSYPTPFMTSNGSLTYRLAALIQRDDIWEVFAKKLINFKGYYNVQYLDLNPIVETKRIQIKTGEVVSTFTVPNTVVVMGRCESLEGILELHGLLESQLNATLTLYRNIIYGGNVHTETIFSQNRQSPVNQNNAYFKWTIVVPMMSRSSYSNELTPTYAVRYYLKYEVFLGTLGVEVKHSAISGTVEVKIGTARDPCGYETTDSVNQTTEQCCQSSRTDRRKSVMSLVSLHSLPPAYSQLTSRFGSMMSLETQPPRYDEVKNND